MEAYMSLKHNAASRLFAVCTLATLSLTAVAQAQPSDRGRGDRDGRGYMMGPGMMDRGHFGRMCSPRAAGFSEWRINRMERAVKPTDAQRAKFDELKAASSKAAETMRTACAAEVPATMAGRMEATEKRLEAMLQAVKSVRPAFEAFYATLSDDQKASLNTGSRRGRFWRWRDRW
jgi:hypothetical protein